MSGLIGRSLEQGADDYIEKGLCPYILLPRVRSLVGAKMLQDELKAEEERLSATNTLLKTNFEELTTILLKILEVRVPGASDRAHDAKACVKFIAERLQFPHEKRKQIVFAALLHEIGKVGLPDGVAGKHLPQPAHDAQVRLPPTPDHRLDDHIHHDGLQGIGRGSPSPARKL